ncbi:MAG: PepSY-associated TM helix domain-containing protein, partial [Anditalea sp.]
DEEDAIEIIAYQDHGSWYNRNTYYYDQYTLELFRVQGDRFSEAGFADQLDMLNYDIHIGSVLGLPGKIPAFFISLICASLPVTGFLVWWNKKKKQRKELPLLGVAKRRNQKKGRTFISKLNSSQVIKDILPD